MLAELKPELDAKPERGQARFFSIESYCKIEPRVTRKEAMFEIESWAKINGYRASMNEVGYVSIIRRGP
jgi:hypothetical protein